MNEEKPDTKVTKKTTKKATTNTKNKVTETKTKKTTVAAKKKTATKKVDTKAKNSIDEKVKKELNKTSSKPTETEVKIDTVKVSETKKERVNKLETDTFDKNLIIAFIVGVLITLITVYLLKLTTPAKLENGQEVIVKYGNTTYTADDYYNDLKKSNGIGALIEQIDLNLFKLNNEYTDEIKENSKQQVDGLKNQYGEQFSLFIQQYGFSNEDALYNYFLNGFVQQAIVEKYAMNKITDEEINEFYKENIDADLEVSHILIMPVTTDEMSADELNKAKADALKKANDIIAKLNNGEDFKTLAITYSDDPGSKDQGGLLPKFNSYGEVKFYDVFTKASYELEVGKYTTTPVESEAGYHIILKHSESEIPALEDMKDTVKKLIATKALSADSTIGFKAMDDYRTKNNMEFSDDVLKAQYKEFLNKSLNE